MEILNGNPQPRLLVDHVVAAPKPVNLFLQSHAVIKGTARSAHYHVLHDNTSITVTNLQKLSLMLYYTLRRSTTGISYAAPTYMANRLRKRGQSYIRLWAENRFAEPTFEYTKCYSSDGELRKTSDEEVSKEKWAMVRTLLTSGVWGSNYHNNPNDTSKKVRLNPWHPNLDGGMFCM